MCAAVRSPLNDINKCVKHGLLKNGEKLFNALKKCCVTLERELMAEVPTLKHVLDGVVAVCG